MQILFCTLRRAAVQEATVNYILKNRLSADWRMTPGTRNRGGSHSWGGEDYNDDASVFEQSGHGMTSF